MVKARESTRSARGTDDRGAVVLDRRYVDRLGDFDEIPAARARDGSDVRRREIRKPGLRHFEARGGVGVGKRDWDIGGEVELV
jgi:hypothetical protein